MNAQNPEPKRIIAQLRQSLSRQQGRTYWQSLREIAERGDFPEHAQTYFPVPESPDPQSNERRRFLQLAAASMAFMSVAACEPEVKPRERVPYVEQPPGIVPGGKARYYATATTWMGYGSGVLIQHRMGRPVKVEGNPVHPASLGATSAIAQATILGLYDPFRAQSVHRNGHIVTWEECVAAIIEQRTELMQQRGRGLAVLTGTVTSPTLGAQMEELRTEFPELRWYHWEAVNRDQARAGSIQAFGRPLEWVPNLAAADVVLAIESDFLDSAPGHLRFAREFASRRGPAENMSRLYAIESTPTLAGSKSDHRLRMRPSQIESSLRYLAASVGAGPQQWISTSHVHASTLNLIAQELRKSGGRALVHVGPSQSPMAHALAHAIHHAIGAMGTTVKAIEPVALEPPNEAHELSDLTDAIGRGKVNALFILGPNNPAFTAPADLDFNSLLKRVPFSVYLGEYADETASSVQWHIPQRHEYEGWSDVRAFDGTATIQQPQLRVGAERRSAHEVLAVLCGKTTPDEQTIVREQWQTYARLHGIADFESFWREALRTGVVPDTAARPASVTLKPDFVPSLPGASPTHSAAAEPSMLSVLFRPDIFLWDGRFADNGWLQEMPRPLTRLTWDNAAFVAPQTAERLGLMTADVVEISLSGRRIRAPVWILPGQADDCVTLPLGFGRRTSTAVGLGVGFDPYPLRTRQTPWEAHGAVIRKVGERHAFAPIQHEMRTHGRDIVHEGTLADFLKNPDFLRTHEPDESLYPAQRYEGIAWAMSINLNACIGCQACVAACQAENNSPVVGKPEVLRGREMHWLRVDRYYEGSLDDPQIVFQPVPCMHCEDAPCEVVCPVHATVHDSEGLNVMVYNRCVGTRFCSNNCPYKVRRFNFFAYAAQETRPPESWNPEVSVRGRGVMEKCTYCLQRTRAAMIDADRENRTLQDGEVVTACQQVCPTRAITFGDRNDARSSVASRKASPLDYAMLADLNTRPRTTYEALIRNPNPDLDHV